MSSIRKKINLNLDNEIIEVLQIIKNIKKKDSISDVINDILKNNEEIKTILKNNKKQY
jgi:hypothetical protein